jgi:hypothetical protein
MGLGEMTNRGFVPHEAEKIWRYKGTKICKDEILDKRFKN